ncbi:MAG: hypothetical protein WBH10_02950, partial [Allopontixanthobacter sediminis]
MVAAIIYKQELLAIGRKPQVPDTSTHLCDFASALALLPKPDHIPSYERYFAIWREDWRLTLT